MAGQGVLEFTDENFDREVIQSNVPVVVDFWAEWCMPCRMLGPTIDDLAKDYTGRVKVGKLDTEANRDTAIRFGINAIPTVMIFQAGQLVRTFQGLRHKRDFVAELDKLAPKS
jgi:thioredoxin 1